MYGRVLAFVLFSFLVWQCNSKKDTNTLFEFVDPNDSGIDFINKIFESEDINIVNHEYVYNGGGVGIADFNNDGLQDIFFTGNMVPNKLYLNQGDFEFKDVSEIAGIGGFKKWKSGVALVDINSDNWMDIYVCATFSQDSTLRENMLFVNKGLDADGNLIFKDEAKAYGIADNSFSSNAGFFDYDSDGDLDLYILTNSRQQGTPVTWRPKVNDGTSTNTDRLYRNNGDETFTNVSRETGIVCEGYGLGLAFLDVNNDNITDVYVGNDYITNDLLYVNHGGKFVNEIDSYIKHQSKFSMGNDVADINNDGNLDIVTVDMLPEVNLRKKTVISGTGYVTYVNDARFGYTHQHIRNMLQLNNGDGTFSEIGMMSGIHQTEWSWSPLFADFDNDGWKDLIVTNGFPRDITDRDFISFREKVNGLVGVKDLLKEMPSVMVPNYAFRNNGDLTFENTTKKWGIDQPSFSSGAAYADLDNDGDLDYVVNNIDAVPSLYQNTLNDNRENNSVVPGFLRVKLVGSAGNKSGLGTKVFIWCDSAKFQYQEQNIYRGYVSTVEETMHFGLGSNSIVDSIRVQWPDGKTQTLFAMTANKVVEFYHKDAKEGKNIVPSSTPKILIEESAALGFDYIHTDDDKIDFNIQRTLPHKFSQSGPGVAVGDINGDGRDDVCLGGAAQYPIVFYLQTSDGKFKKSKSMINKDSEDECLLLFDVDGDKDLDLFSVSGSYEFEPGSPNYQHRLYLNDGRGNFKSDKSLPKIISSGSCVRAGDMDGDGDLDLFIGGKAIAGKYPFADSSYLLVNSKGKLTDMTKVLSPGLQNVGMINDAIWSDYDADGDVDLLLVGEFMPLTIFKNEKGILSNVNDPELSKYRGWMTSINGGDFDRDGDIDYVVGNLGLNNYFNVATERPLTVYGKDFDSNGSIDPILSCYTLDADRNLKPFPVHYWDELNSQSPKFRRMFEYYREYAATPTTAFFSEGDLKDALILEANFMQTSFVENLGNGKFSLRPFPNLVQIAPVNGIVIDFIDQDDFLDILMVGNDYSNEPGFGQYDAFTGLLLKGDGKNNFKVVSSKQSGFKVWGDAKGLAKISRTNGDLFVATQNRDSLKVFQQSFTERGHTIEPAPLDTWAELVFADGKKQRIEFYYGAGYLSQSTRNVRIPIGVKEIKIFNSKGDARTVSLSN